MALIGVPDEDDGGSNPAIANATIVTTTNQLTTLPNSRRMVAGTNISLDTSTSGVVRITAAGGSGGGGGPTDASLVAYSNTTSGLSALTVQAAIDEVVAESSGGGGGGSAAEVTYDNSGVLSRGDDVQEAVTNLFGLVAGVPTLIRSRFLIRGGINGIVTGTVDDSQAQVNLTAMQAIVDAADAAGGGVEMDQVTVQIAGGPLIVRSSANGLIWDSPTFARLEQRTNNVAVLQLGDATTQCQNLDFSGINLHYVNDQAGNTGANACTIFDQWKARISKIQVASTITSARPYRGFYLPQGQSVFSCHFEDLFSFQAHFSLLHIANFGTGNIWDNIYLSNSGIAGTAQTCSTPFLWEIGSGSQMHDSVFNQLNIEWCLSNKLMRINNVRGAVFNSLHIEQCKLAGANSSVLSNVISNVQINGGCILDIRLTNTDLTDSFPTIVRTFNNGRTLWNNFVWVNNSTAYVTVPYYLHYQPDNEGYQTQPGKVQFKPFALIDGSGTVLRDNLKIDRTMGATDKDSADWGNLYLQGASEVHSGAAMTRVFEGEHRMDISKTIYMADHIEGVLTIPGALTSNITVTLSNRMGPTNSRWATLPVPENSFFSVIRGGTTTNSVQFNNHDGTSIISIGNGVASTRLNFMFNSSGNWVVAS